MARKNWIDLPKLEASIRIVTLAIIFNLFMIYHETIDTMKSLHTLRVKFRKNRRLQLHTNCNQCQWCRKFPIIYDQFIQYIYYLSSARFKNCFYIA